jgi:hypothetical protein
VTLHVVEFARVAGDGAEVGRGLVSANLLGSHKVDILVKGTQIPSNLLHTVQDAMQCVTGKQILMKVQMLW